MPPQARSNEGLLEDLSRGDHAVKLPHSIPGIGDFFFSLIRYEVEGKM